jgi:hypothetical protein
MLPDKLFEWDCIGRYDEIPQKSPSDPSTSFSSDKAEYKR